MKRAHTMPFGARPTAAGAAHFTLWAPGAQSVHIEIRHDRGRIALPMQAQQGGWYAVEVDAIAPGARYRFRIDDRLSVPDPASRCNPQDVHAESMLVDPHAFDWPDEQWRGRPWHEAVIYELHVGTFTPAGTFNAAIERLDYLVRLGVTAIELMPVADFPGKRNWGYDGVLLFAPDASYGTPEDLKNLVAAAHARGIMVILDVVYNHFGPEGNYLHAYAPQFFNAAHQTPWGAAINFDGAMSSTVRSFFIHNALYWLDEYHFDGLRLDAVHAIADDSDPDIIRELAEAVQSGPGASRHVHLILENDRNQARYLHRDIAQQPLHATAQWNDDFHHALHVLVTGERDGYYEDYAQKPLWLLGRTLAEGFGYQGEASPHRGGEPRGEPSAMLPPAAFIVFTQTHDQVGNRALGERIAMLAGVEPLRLGVACLLLAPATPMLFMGDEFAASTPFLFFCDFGPELASAVRDGRRSEFAAFERFRDPAAQAQIPDPNAVETFAASRLKWDELTRSPHAEWHTFYSHLLEIRRSSIVPHLAGTKHAASFAVVAARGLVVDWTLGDGSRLALRANFSAEPWHDVPLARGTVIFATNPQAPAASLPPWSGRWVMERAIG